MECCSLIVDDNPVILRLCRAVLEDMGFRVLSAGSGEEALAVLATEGDYVDLLLTDIRMGPDMDGIELGARVMERYGRIRIIYMSGFASGGLVSQMLASESALFLPKPFTVSELTAIVEKSGAAKPTP